MKKYFVLILLSASLINLISQNLGFESGDTDGWVYKVNGVVKTPINSYNSGLYVTQKKEVAHPQISQSAVYSEGGRHSLMLGTFNRGESNTRKVHSIERQIELKEDEVEIPLHYSLYYESHDGYFRISVYDSVETYYNLYSLLRIPFSKFDFITPIVANSAFKRWTPIL